MAVQDLVMARLTMCGAQRGALTGLPPIGTPITVSVTGVERVAQGRMVEHCGPSDQLGPLHQVGVIPGTGHASAKFGCELAHLGSTRRPREGWQPHISHRKRRVVDQGRARARPNGMPRRDR